jgi:quinol monooxygenase YgiN
MIVIAGSVKVKPEGREQALAAAVRMMEATRAEPGCRAYRFSTDLVEPTLVHLFEEWESAEALAQHFASPHMAEFQRVLPEVLAGGLDLRRYTVTSVDAM